MDPDGLRLRGNRMCINIYSPPFTFFFPTKTGEKKKHIAGHTRVRFAPFLNAVQSSCLGTASITRARNELVIL